MGAYLYILRCGDGSYYVGTRRHPVILAFQQYFGRIEDAVSAERQIKSWCREKKEA